MGQGSVPTVLQGDPLGTARLARVTSGPRVQVIRVIGYRPPTPKQATVPLLLILIQWPPRSPSPLPEGPNFS